MIINIFKKIIGTFGYKLLRKRPGFDIQWIPIIPDSNRLNLLEFLIKTELVKGWNGLIQIGANDGINSDPIREFIIKYNLQSILIEPNIFIFDKLKKNYEKYSNVVLENSAITHDEHASSKIFFYELKSKLDNDNTDYSGFSTLDEQIIKKVQLAYPNTYINKLLVNCLSVASLLEKYRINKLSVLVIDAEGLDFILCKEFFRNNLFPSLIYVEILHQQQKDIEELINTLILNDYLIGGNISDLIAYRKV
jgi:FkbM family methyltransferase